MLDEMVPDLTFFLFIVSKQAKRHLKSRDLKTYCIVPFLCPGEGASKNPYLFSFLSIHV